MQRIDHLKIEKIRVTGLAKRGGEEVGMYGVQPKRVEGVEFKELYKGRDNETLFGMGR
jgi:hypothetical protein